MKRSARITGRAAVILTILGVVLAVFGHQARSTSGQSALPPAKQAIFDHIAQLRAAGRQGILPCHASALSAVVGLGALTQALAGATYITNPTRYTCVLRGYPRVRFYDAHGHYAPTALEFGKFTFLAQQPVSARDVRLGLLRPKHQAFFYLEWTNWCDGAVYYPLTLRVTIPGMVGELHVRDSGGAGYVYHGARRQAIPQCQSATRPSILAVSSIRLIAPGHAVFKP